MWLIKQTKQDAEPSSIFAGELTEKDIVRAWALFAFVVLTVGGIALFFILGALQKQTVVAKGGGVPYTSQSVPLLTPLKNPDPNGGKGGGDITAIGGALYPETGPSGSIADIIERPQSDQISLYVVREGDSLSQIADMFGVSVNTIVWGNDITKGSLISPGQTLVILPISGVRHTVKSGETLASIAKKYKGDLTEILEYNGLSESSSLAVGDVVVIPDGILAAPTPSYTPTRSTSGPSVAGYFIKPTRGIKTQGIHGYNGVDFGASVGTPIVAAASGNVIISRQGGWNGGYGTYIVIRHPNGTQTLYAHNSQNIVGVGEWVVQGQVIGYVGNTGRSTGPHLHFEVRGAANPF